MKTWRPEKGQYRSLYVSLWDDPEFQCLKPRAQLVFLALRTGRECNFPCLFVFYRSSLYERLVLMPEAEVNAGIDDLIEAGWVQYERPLLWIVKGLRNDPHYVVDNSKQRLGIENILKGLPKLQIVKDFAAFYGFPLPWSDEGMDEGIHEGIEEGTDAPMEAGKGNLKGKENTNQDLPPVHKSKARRMSTGTGGRGEGSDPPPPVPPMSEELLKAQNALLNRRKALGIN